MMLVQQYQEYEKEKCPFMPLINRPSNNNEDFY
jgi:hypothetical protein